MRELADEDAYMKAVERDDKTSLVDRQATRLPDKSWRSWLLRGLTGLGIASILFYFAWWGSADRLSSPWHLLIVILVVIYLTPQFLGTWLLYLLACRRIAPQSPPDGLSVDVFVTVCGEHYELVERSLTAA